MPKLSRLQTTLIDHAKARPDGALLPAPEGVSATGTALSRALEGLVKRGGATCAPVPDADDNARAFFLTEAGRAALDPSSGTPGVDAEVVAPPAPARPGGKLGAVLKAIGRKRGATLAELADTTGWQPHTTRAALTRLRQRGFPAALTEEGGRKAYRLQG